MPKQQRYVENILANGKHLLQLVNDILDLSKIEAGRMDLRLEEFSLQQTIDRAVSVTQPLAQKKGLAFDGPRTRGRRETEATGGSSWAGVPLTICICPDPEMIHYRPALTEAWSLARGSIGSARLAKWMHHEGARFFHS